MRGDSTYSCVNFVSESKLAPGKLASWLYCKYLSLWPCVVNIVGKQNNSSEKKEEHRTHKKFSDVRLWKVPAGRLCSSLCSKFLQCVCVCVCVCVWPCMQHSVSVVLLV